MRDCVVGPGVLPRPCNFNDLQCQTSLRAVTGAKGIFLRCQTEKFKTQNADVYKPRAMLLFTLILGYLENVASKLGRKRQWRQHIKASAFAEPFMWRFPASRTQWDIAIADHADPGRVAPSMHLPFGNPPPCGSPRVRNILPRSKKLKSVSGNIAGNAVVIL